MSVHRSGERLLASPYLKVMKPMGGPSKKLFSQKVVNAATTGMPSPVRKFSGNRIIAAVIVLSLPVLLATGVVSVKWENGRPRLSSNQQKSAEIKREAAEEIEKLQAEDRGGIPSLVPHFGDKETSRSEVAAELPLQEFSDNVSQRVAEVQDRFDNDHQQTGSLLPAAGEARSSAQPANGALSKLKHRLQGLR
jgi:hypothetical protein